MHLFSVTLTNIFIVYVPENSSLYTIVFFIDLAPLKALM